ncbi:unnamed protein product [Rotaria sp. Silwood1]|nr:unnamed protein product [Rotaria sp. Silwood1]CAF1286307.1 unnamed protein product [Rotaria sp. Silwood1]CAF3514669.1 unnamed protein product [Rotaria sp. Silwood1]CAF4702332.1 unnamed protein product [Rotaria sp. Silwood1]
MARKNENLITRIQQIGEGGFGTVYIGSYREYKEVGIKDVNSKLSADALAEANILKTLTHPNIIQYIDIVQTPNQTSIIMEFIDGGSLYNYIKRTTQSLTYWKVTRQMMIDVAHGMAYLHSQHIVHADLKSLNVLLRHNYSAVICDFGLARTIADSRAVTTCYVRGTVIWFAPELCFDRPERSSFQSDVWAYGCILLEIISQKIPWEDDYSNDNVLINALAKPENAIIFENICLRQRAPEKLRAILCRCCSWQKDDRPKFPTIVQELTAISDVDIHNINQGKEKPVSSNSSKTRPSTSNKQSPTKASSSTSKVNDAKSDEYITTMAELKLENPNRKRKSSSVRRADDATIEDTKRYDSSNDRYLYKGPRGGWYYLTSNGSKVYIKTD